LATLDWLTALIAALDNSKADVVLGPVQSIMIVTAPIGMRKGDFHSTRPVWVGGERAKYFVAAPFAWCARTQNLGEPGNRTLSHAVAAREFGKRGTFGPPLAGLGLLRLG
jgi:hypothetical protein